MNRWCVGKSKLLNWLEAATQEHAVIFIGDIGGQYQALLSLIAQLPDNEEIILLGDLVDRGPDSRKVVEWAIQNEQNGVTTLKGNHEDMMIDFYDRASHGAMDLDYIPRYERGIWQTNGGLATIRSYGDGMSDFLINAGPHVKWLRERKHSIHQLEERPFWTATHAPFGPVFNDNGIPMELWHREAPQQMEDRFQIYGHNAAKEIKWHENHDGYRYAVCIDTSRGEKLTALMLPTMQLWEQSYSKIDNNHEAWR